MRLATLLGCLTVALGTATAAQPALAKDTVLRGKAAKDFVAHEKQRDLRIAHLLDNAEQDMRALGWRKPKEVPADRAMAKQLGIDLDDDTMVVLLDAQEQASADTPPGLWTWLCNLIDPPVGAQTVTVAPGTPYGGYLVWTNRSDGVNTTWEGNITGKRNNGLYAGLNAQYNIGTKAWKPTTIYQTQTSAGPPRPPRPPGGSGTWHGGACNGGTAPGTQVAPHVIGHSFARAGTDCAISAVGCWCFGPNYWMCVGGACVTRITKAFLEEMGDWQYECSPRCQTGGCQ